MPEAKTVQQTPDSHGKQDGDENPHLQEPPALTFWQLLSSTAAAAFGVQTSKNRERDFNRGKASHFIAMGIGFTVVFVLVIASIVSFVLP